MAEEQNSDFHHDVIYTHPFRNSTTPLIQGIEDDESSRWKLSNFPAKGVDSRKNQT